MANKYLVGSGSFTSTSIWSDTYGGPSGAVAPVSGDIIQVDTSYNITSALPSDSTFDFIVYLGNNTTSGVTLGLSGSPTFRSLIIQSKNTAAHTVNFTSPTGYSVTKFVGIGSSSVNRLTINQNDGTGLPSNMNFDPLGSCYGQYLSMQLVQAGTIGDVNTAPDFPLYIGSNSIDDNGYFTLQDPPKISTLVDPLTTAPSSNSNWTVTGTVTQVATGHDGGGYQIYNNDSKVVSSGTFDLVDSKLAFEVQWLTVHGFYGMGWFGIGMNIGQVVGGQANGDGNNNFAALLFYTYDFVESANIYDGIEDNSRYFSIEVDSSSKTATIKSSNDGVTWRSDICSLSDTDLLFLRSTRFTASVPGLSSEYAHTLGSINPSFNQSPTTTLSSPANATRLTTPTPTLIMTATDPEGDAVSYEIQVDTSSSFNSQAGNPFIDVTDGNYTSGASHSYTLTDALTTGGITYYWRVRATDPSGSNSYGAWSETRTMITQAIAPTVTSGSSSSITINSATVGGNVTSDGGATITQRGIAYATTSNPTTASSKVAVTGTVGAFTANLTGLNSNTAYHYRAYAINSKGTSYGSDKTFTTPAKPPVLQTGTASGTTTSSFTVTGNGITSNPDSQTITEYGVVYATTQNPTTTDTKKTSTAGTSSYDVTLSSLAENTTYYVRAYAIWGSGSVAYGSQISYKTQGRPVVVLNAPVETTDDTKPKLLFTGTDADNNSITYQLQIDTSSLFTSIFVDTLSATDPGFSNLSTTKTNPFYSGNQIQYQVQTDLERGSIYHWRVRGKDVNGTNTWGEWSTENNSDFYINPVLATLTTDGSHDIDFDSAQVDATIISNGGAAITERGVVWGAATNPTTADSKVTEAGTDSAYTSTLTGLTSSTTYYARAYAINPVGTAYGNNITFSTAQTPAVPTVITGSAAFTTDITSQFNGNAVTLDGTFPVTERGIVFNETGTPTTDDRKIVSPSAGLGSYDLKMTGLDAATTYYVRAYAINSYGTGYGDEASFMTAAAFVPDEGDGYWSWSPGQSQTTVGRTQATPAYSSVNLPLEDLNLINGEQYTFYFGSVDSDNGTPYVVLERYNDTTPIENTITPATPFTFTYDTTLIHWNLRLFVTDATAEADTITAVFNDLYLAQESTFSGYVPFTPKDVTEVKITNNEIVDDRRSDVISSIFDQVHGVSWYPFNVDTEGLGYFEIGDRFTIVDDQGVSKSVVAWNTKLTIDGSIKENLYTNQPTLTDTDYTKAGNSKLGGNLRNTQLQVDKQQGTINALVSDMYTYDGVVNQKYTELLQDNESIIATIQGAGGVNLLKNSVMYAFDDESVPDSWTMTGAGTLTIQASPESLAAGAVSGNQFTLSDKTATQTVTVRKDVDFIADADKTYYSISARVKKNIVGSAAITLTNRNETLTIDLPDQTSYFWDVVTLEGILPKDDHYDIVITSDADADLQVTDLILAPGQTRHEWTQANGENMNASVAITEDGITIRQSEFKNNYTKIDALGFEVHKRDGGGERIFGFNDDETNVSKLKADKQIGMAPMRVVPVDFDTYKGWAWTPSEETP